MNTRDDSGVALVITLLVLTLLLTSILEFNLGMRVEARAAANFRDDMKAYYLARSGITFAMALLEEDS
ncbi:MAG: general secretion pathway protein GspK, partial [Nitrospirae bacterium]|nr:general secretion pathway protein GspK [Nitrospirota bacterium]